MGRVTYRLCCRLCVFRSGSRAIPLEEAWSARGGLRPKAVLPILAMHLSGRSGCGAATRIAAPPARRSGEVADADRASGVHAQSRSATSRALPRRALCSQVGPPVPSLSQSLRATSVALHHFPCGDRVQDIQLPNLVSRFKSRSSTAATSERPQTRFRPRNSAFLLYQIPLCGDLGKYGRYPNLPLSRDRPEG